MERERKEQERRDLEMAEKRALEEERQVQLLETKQANIVCLKFFSFVFSLYNFSNL